MIVFGEENKGLEDHAPFLTELSEEEDNRLRIKIALSVIGKTADAFSEISDFSGDEKIAKIFSGAVLVYPDYDRIYDIVFDRYIMYQVRNESYSSWDNYEIRKGKYFIVFEQSRLLDYLSTATDCRILCDGSFYPDRWNHYGIYCQNHIIDIVTAVPPEVKLQIDGKT